MGQQVESAFAPQPPCVRKLAGQSCAVSALHVMLLGLTHLQAWPLLSTCRMCMRAQPSGASLTRRRSLCVRRVQLTLHTPSSNQPLSLQGTFSPKIALMRGRATGGDTGSVTLDRAAGHFELELEIDETDSEAGAVGGAVGPCPLAQLPALRDTIAAQPMLHLPTSDVVLYVGSSPLVLPGPVQSFGLLRSTSPLPPTNAVGCVPGYRLPLPPPFPVHHVC